MTHTPQALSAFVQEARELLAAMETVLLQMAIDGVDKAGIDAVFRAVHTIKGSASIFAFDHIVDFAHTTENVLDKVRHATLNLDEVMRTVLLACNDYISSQIDAIEQGKEEQAGDLRQRAMLEEQLSVYLAAPQARTPSRVLDKEKKGSGVVSKKSAARYKKRVDTGVFAKTPYWYLSLRFDPDLFRYGMDPVTFITRLGMLGVITGVRVIDELLPVHKRMDPERCYIGFEIVFQSEAAMHEIIAVFDLVAEDSRIIVIPPFSDIGAYRAVMTHFRKKETCMQLLLHMHVLDGQELAVLAETDQMQALGMAGSQHDALLLAGGQAAGQPRALASVPRDLSENQFIRIEVDKLDALIDLVGELVIAGATVSLVAKIKRDQRYQEMTQAVTELVEKIRDTALTFRMVKINEVFQRFPRVIREIARELGKDVDLVITGEETEVDKSMMEKISNPLMHLVRNAIDHGIESTADRLANGKDKKGTITLHARNESGSIVIEISDDGRGIDPHKVLAKAVEQGLVQDGDVLTPADILDLIFAPGFSTADTITAISGRGVGMDVVKRNIDQLQGKVTIHSVEGKGTTMRIRLPLTLAIISGFQVIVGDMVFVLPLDMVVECINIGHYPVSNHIVTLRGEALSFINLRTLFELPDRNMARKNMLVVQYAEHRIGLLVDELQGECQAVVKPLNKLFVKMKGLSGSAILGDGRIALILDVAHLVEYARQGEHAALAASGQRSR